MILNGISPTIQHKIVSYLNRTLWNCILIVYGRPIQPDTTANIFADQSIMDYCHDSSSPLAPPCWTQRGAKASYTVTTWHTLFRRR